MLYEPKNMEINFTTNFKDSELNKHPVSKKNKKSSNKFNSTALKLILTFMSPFRNSSLTSKR